MNRLLQFFFAIILLLIFLIPMIIISILIKLNSSGPIIHFSKRVGFQNNIFLMPKFRTMKINTPQIDTNNFNDSGNYVTSFGKILRRFSLDELPQLFCIINGTMSFIGPRPALFNQYDLIELRNNFLINEVKPGITGWAQINGRDNLSIEKKVELEIFFIQNKSFSLIVKILFKTIFKFFSNTDIKH